MRSLDYCGKPIVPYDEIGSLLTADYDRTSCVSGTTMRRLPKTPRSKLIQFGRIANIEER